MRSTALGLLIEGFVVTSTAWMAMALYYHWPRWSMRMAISLAPIVVVGAAAATLPLPMALAAWFAVFAAVTGWWLTRRPLAHRDWATGMEVPPRVAIDGDTIRVRHFRHFDYDASGVALPHLEERTFDLSKLRSVDYFLSHWTGPIMAHTLVSFGFDDGQFMAISVEARRQRWQHYSPLWGLFRAYELMFVIGDERDIVRLRTNIRRERVYLYRVRLPVDRVRTLLCDYLQRAEAIAERPEWYHSIVSNCTTNLFFHPHRHLRWWLKPGVFVNGLSARALYKSGALATDMPFHTLRQRSAIQDLALAAGNDPDFSRQIRARLVDAQPSTEALST